MKNKNQTNNWIITIKPSVIISTIIVYLLGFIMIMPFLWMISTSLKPLNEVFIYPMRWIPEQINLNGYKTLLKTPSVGEPIYIYFLNSIKVAIIVLTGTLLSCSMAAYAFTKINFKGRDIIFTVYLAGMMVPYLLLMLPTFMMFRFAGLINNLSSQWIFSLFGIPFGSTINLFLIDIKCVLNLSINNLA